VLRGGLEVGAETFLELAPGFVSLYCYHGRLQVPSSPGIETYRAKALYCIGTPLRELRGCFCCYDTSPPLPYTPGYYSGSLLSFKAQKVNRSIWKIHKNTRPDFARSYTGALFGLHSLSDSQVPSDRAH